jgi:hypothetical protein
MEIKPCPFCGDIPYLERKPLWTTYSNDTTHGYYGCYEYVIRCRDPKCGCSVNLGLNDTIYRTDEIAKQNAINAWNRRVRCN